MVPIGSMDTPASATPPPRLAWKWILEKLVDSPDFGVAFCNEVITNHVTDIDEPHCRPLLERVALRNLEEMVLTNQIDWGAIPLLKTLSGQDLGRRTTGASVKQRFNKELVLRVQTEVVLSVLRRDVDEGEKDWPFYEAELERIFGEAEEDNRLLDRKRELSALLKPKNQTKAIVAAYFEKYSLNKLRNDLYSFIDEKRDSFKTMFLDQLSRDFLDANGIPFSEELDDMEKPTKVEAIGEQDHVGTVNVEVIKTPKVKVTGDQHIVLGTSRSSGKKRRRRKILPTQGNIGNDELEEAEEGSAGMKKSRKGVESCKHRAEEPMSCTRNFGPDVMRSCSPAAHESIGMEGAEISPREPIRTNKHVHFSDVESDAEAQAAKRLSADDEDILIEKGDGDKHNTKGAQSLSENGSDWGHPQNIVKIKVVRKETVIVQSEQKIQEDRKEASTDSPEVEVPQQEDNENFVAKNEFIPLDCQDNYEEDFLEVGIDGHEEVCHVCGEHGELRCCVECPISMHWDCIKGLGLRLPESEEDWYCPVCMSLKAAREAAEAEKAALVAKEKLKAFKMETRKRRSLPEGDALHHNSQEKAVKQSRPRASSLPPGENDRALKPKQQSDEEPKLRHTEGQEDSDPSKASLVSTVLRKALHQLNQVGKHGSDHSVPEDKPRSNRVRTPHKKQPSHDQEASRRDPFAASSSGQVKRKSERFARSSKKKGPEVDSGEESAEQAEVGVPEPGSGAGGPREIEGDKDRGAKSKGRKQGALFGGRRKLPGVRRKPLPWTRQEEHALKEGVKLFSHNGSWGFQWRRILEFGQGRFDPSRTDVDLKDKWRNLVRGVS